jgi:hypothetical protein
VGKKGVKMFIRIVKSTPTRTHCGIVVTVTESPSYSFSENFCPASLVERGVSPGQYFLKKIFDKIITVNRGNFGCILSFIHFLVPHENRLDWVVFHLYERPQRPAEAQGQKFWGKTDQHRRSKRAISSVRIYLGTWGKCGNH